MKTKICQECGEEHPYLDLFNRYLKGVTTIIDETELLLASQEQSRHNKLKRKLNK